MYCKPLYLGLPAQWSGLTRPLRSAGPVVGFIPTTEIRGQKIFGKCLPKNRVAGLVLRASDPVTGSRASPRGGRVGRVGGLLTSTDIEFELLKGWAPATERYETLPAVSLAACLLSSYCLSSHYWGVVVDSKTHREAAFASPGCAKSPTRVRGPLPNHPVRFTRWWHCNTGKRTRT